MAAARPEHAHATDRPATATLPPRPAHMMIVLLLFLQKQNLALAVYLFGIGTLLTGLGSKKNTCDSVLTMTSKVPW